MKNESKKKNWLAGKTKYQKQAPKSLTKCEKGITLIALVVTIVVLLILAGITITFVLGEGGILDMAKEAAKRTNDAKEQELKDFADFQNQVENWINGEVSSGSGSGGVTPTPADPTLEVKLKVNESEVTGELIPVTVEEVTKIGDASQKIEGNFTYTWYIADGTETVGTNSHSFDGLDKKKTYTLKCKVVNENGDWGAGEVTVISFKIHTKYYRATKGMTWSSFTESGYDTTPPVLTDLEFRHRGDHSGEEYFRNLRCDWLDSSIEVGFECIKCRETVGDDVYYDGKAWVIRGEKDDSAIIQDRNAIYFGAKG